MVKLRFVYREPLEVAPLDREVSPGELIDVDPDIYAAYDWPKTHWRVMSGARRKKPTKKTAAKKTMTKPAEPAEGSSTSEEK